MTIPGDVIRRRFRKGREKLALYQGLVDNWFFYDNRGSMPRRIEAGGK